MEDRQFAKLALLHHKSVLNFELSVTRMLPIIALVAFVVLVNAREQHVFSLHSPRIQTITPHRHKPWSLLLSRHKETSNCAILSAPAQAQVHKSVEKPGDVVVINRSSTSATGWEGLEECTLEIIGFDRRVIWAKASELCASIESDVSYSADILAEYEVV